MIGLVIITHSGLAREYIAAIDHIIGHQSGIIAIEIGAHHHRDKKRCEIAQAIKTVDCGHGVVLVTDMHGGSPFNLACACSNSTCRMLCGVNLPMLIKLVRSRRLDVETAVSCALESGRKYMIEYTKP